MPPLFRMATTISEVMSSALFLQLVFCAITTAILVVAIDVDNILTLTTVISVEGILCTITPTFVFCNLSESITSGLLSVGDIFYGCGWHQLPLEQQKCIILPLLRSQKQLRMTGLGMMDCSLGVFIKVCSKSEYLGHKVSLRRVLSVFIAANCFLFHDFEIQILRTTGSYLLLIQSIK